MTWGSGAGTTKSLTDADTYTSDVMTLSDTTDTLQLSVKLIVGTKGTTATTYVQTSIDEGSTWFDIGLIGHGTAGDGDTQNWLFATRIGDGEGIMDGTDGAMDMGTVNNGILGDRIRLKTITTGTYASTTLSAYYRWQS